jgi:hypothetical protein
MLEDEIDNLKNTMDWNYSSQTEMSSGYEDVLEYLKSFSSDIFLNQSEKDKEKMVLDVFNIYRSKNIYPITYYNNDGILNQINKCVD